MLMASTSASAGLYSVCRPRQHCPRSDSSVQICCCWEQCLQHQLVTMKRYSEISWQLQQQVVIHFCVKLGQNFTQIKTSLSACYGRVLCDSSIYFWIRAFQGGWNRIVDSQRAKKSWSGRSRANIRRIENLVTEDRRVTVRQISAQTGIKFTSVQKILKCDLHLEKKCAKFVPYDLTE